MQGKPITVAELIKILHKQDQRAAVGVVVIFRNDNLPHIIELTRQSVKTMKLSASSDGSPDDVVCLMQLQESECDCSN